MVTIKGPLKKGDKLQAMVLEAVGVRLPFEAAGWQSSENAHLVEERNLLSSGSAPLKAVAQEEKLSAPAKKEVKEAKDPDQKFLEKLNRSEQLKLLSALGNKKAPNLEKERVALLLQLFKEKPKESVKAIKELGLI